jgi:hypothetical protein
MGWWLWPLPLDCRPMRVLIGLLACLIWATPAAAAPLPQDELERSCWLRYSAERTRVNLKEPTLVDFSNLQNVPGGVQLRSPFLVEFAIRGMGVAPAGKAQQGTGHHHLLVDTPLPYNVSEKIPFSDTHKHFGKGQTATVLDLPPGRHTLRLLFADHEHRPYFAYSPEVVVNVTGARTAQPVKIDRRNFDTTCAAWYQDELVRPRPPGEWVAIINLREGETVSSPFNLRFGVDGFGVCAVGQSIDRTGHFLLEILRDGQLQRSSELGNGATQTNLALANGNYVLRLRFVDRTGRNDLLPPTETRVTVASQERL